MRTNIYVDGFNLYYGALKGTKRKWLDLNALATTLLPNDQINKIRYFTARVKPRANDPQLPQRQQAYIRALKTIPNLKLHFGSFRESQRRMPLVEAPHNLVEVIYTEEKGSDVNLASWLLADCFAEDFQQAIIISNDSDLREPLRMVRDDFDRHLGVFSPNAKSIVLARVANFSAPISKQALDSAQFPSTLQDQHGTISKPPTW